MGSIQACVGYFGRSYKDTNMPFGEIGPSPLGFPQAVSVQLNTRKRPARQSRVSVATNSILLDYDVVESGISYLL